MQMSILLNSQQKDAALVLIPSSGPSYSGKMPLVSKSYYCVEAIHTRIAVVAMTVRSNKPDTSAWF